MQDGLISFLYVFTQNEFTKLRVSLALYMSENDQMILGWFTGNSYDRLGQFHRLDHQTYVHHHTNNFDVG